MTHSSEKRPLDLIIDGNDISEFVDEWANHKETRAEWTVHTGLVPNHRTYKVLQPLTNEHGQTERNVWVKFRLRAGGNFGPWCSGYASIAWRFSDSDNEELILHGIGRLKKEVLTTDFTGASFNAKISMTTSIGGRVVEKEEGIGTLRFAEEDPKEKADREEQFRLVQDSEIEAFTSPEFVLFLADSANSSFRLLHEEGMSQNKNGVVYSSLIFLPLAIEYYLKYLLIKRAGRLEKKYRNHKLLVLLDGLPLELQRNVDKAFQGELRLIGREDASEDLRVFLMKSQNTFTTFRYLFELQLAKDSRHLLMPDNIAVLACVSNALERVSHLGIT